MIANSIDIIGRIAADLVDSRNARSDAKSVLEKLCDELDAELGFVCLDRRDTRRPEVVAAEGLDAAQFRRLEARIQSGSLTNVIKNASQRINPISRNALAFLSDTDLAITLISTPITTSGKPIGAIVLAFEDASTIDNAEFTKVIDIAARLIARTLRAENSEREESRKLLEENSNLKQELKGRYDFSNLIGNSSPMRQVQDQAAQVARSNAAVLLRGESGTGKETIARAIHYNSLRNKRPFVKVSCGALPGSQIESALFGYEKGTVTGTDRMKKGRIEAAEGGTLFLDEIADLPVKTQVRLLRVLQENEFEREDGDEAIRSNIRLIAATNKDLEAATRDGSFREDLFYRLNIFTIFLPPLRDRKSDILLLAEHFLEKYETEHNKRIRRISTPAIDMLTAYHFPGNVRELENAIERAVVVCDSNVIHPHHLPPTLQTAEVSGTETSVTLAAAVASFESGLIQDTLKSSRGNIAQAAKMLDSTERILGYKIKKYGIDPIRFRR